MNHFNLRVVAQSLRCVQLLCDPTCCGTPGFPVLHYLPDLLKLMSTELVMPSKYLILYCPLLFLPSIFPSIGVFSKELALHISWPKDWSFSFSISPSSEYSELMIFRIDWLDLLLWEPGFCVMSRNCLGSSIHTTSSQSLTPLSCVIIQFSRSKSDKS